MTNTIEFAPVFRDYESGDQYGIFRRVTDENGEQRLTLASFRDRERRDERLVELLADPSRDIATHWHTEYTFPHWDVSWPVPEFPAQTVAVEAEDTRDYKALYEQLWATLGAEANKRQWCSEYDEFAAANDGPARPPRIVQRRVTLGFNFPLEVPEDQSAEAVFHEMTNRERRDLVRAHLGQVIADAHAYWGVTVNETVATTLIDTLSSGIYIHRHAEI